MEDKKPEITEETSVVEEVISSDAGSQVVAPVTPPVKKRNYFTYIAIALVVVALVAVWLRLEREGRVDTQVFNTVAGLFAGDPTVVTIDGTKLRESDLELSVEQLTQAAAAQGVDTTTEIVQAEIRSQAIQILTNTTLLTAAAEKAGIEVTKEAVDARRVELEEAAGGAEVMQARMTELNIEEGVFEDDIRTELTITQLLEGVFAEADTTATEEEVQAVYDRASGSGADVPPLEEVRSQIEVQISQTKEQDVVAAYIDELRAAADIVTPE